MSSMSLITILLYMSSVQNKFLKIQKVEWAVVPPDLGGGEFQVDIINIFIEFQY